MGLLDEAIRDHLELKRRHGADPAEVAREQHEVLDPAPDRAPPDALDQSGEDAPPSSAPDEDVDLAPLAADQVAAHSAGEGPPPSIESEGATGAGEASGMEETAELDMKAVFERGASGEADETALVSEPIAGQEHLDFEQDAPSGAQPPR
jgi:hypothetical protein